MLAAVGTFAAQAATTGLVGHAAPTDRAGTSGLCLAAYFGGELAGSAALGSTFDRFGWEACVLLIGLALVLGATLTSYATVAE